MLHGLAYTKYASYFKGNFFKAFYNKNTKYLYYLAQIN